MSRKNEVVEPKKPAWESPSVTKIPYVYRCVKTGNYEVRKRIHGKLRSRSLKTTKPSRARTKVNDAVKGLEKQYYASASSSIDEEILKTVGDAMEAYKKRKLALPLSKFKSNSRKALVNSQKKLINSWPGIEELTLKKVTTEQCNDWLIKFQQDGTGFIQPGAKKTKADPPAWDSVDKAIKSLKDVFKEAIRAHIIYESPAKELSPGKKPKKRIYTPESYQFDELIEFIRNKMWNGYRRPAADLAEGIAYSGMRIGEANALTIGDLDFSNGVIMIDKQLQDGNYNAPPKTEESTRSIPMLPRFKKLALTMLSERPRAHPNDLFFEVEDINRSLASACKSVNQPKITHHTLRHFYACECLKAGVRERELQGWFGHEKGSKTLSEIYWHLRLDTSLEQAQLVTFGDDIEADNVIKIEDAKKELEAAKREIEELKAKAKGQSEGSISEQQTG